MSRANDALSPERLVQLAAEVGQRQGWDFSRVRDAIGPRPWSYGGVVRRYMQIHHRVLDIGTGGGERFLALAAHFDTGVGIDPDPAMIAAACANTPPNLSARVTFVRMTGAALELPLDSFDLVLNRHAPAFPDQIARVLKPGGFFITQQVGARNAVAICTLFGCGPGGHYQPAPRQTVRDWVADFTARGWAVRAQGEYDVPYTYLDVASFLFWLQAVPVPEDFDIARHGEQVAHIIRTYGDAEGIHTNVHRELLVVQKPG